MGIPLGTISTKIKGTNEDIINKLAKKAEPVISRRIDRAKNEIKTEVLNQVEKQVRKSYLILALKGDYSGYENGLDLQAEFGLSDSMANEAIEDIVKILTARSNITLKKIETSRVNSGLLLAGFSVEGMDSDNYNAQLESMSSGRYLSGDREIAWMDWVLNQQHDISSTVGIDYYLSAELVKISRSKRAFMTSSDDATRTPWNMTAAISPHFGSNIIEDIFLSPDFKERIVPMIEKAIKKVFR